MKNLAELVLAWARADDAISHDGWDGGELEQAWESAKKKMVDEANAISEGNGNRSRELVVKEPAKEGDDSFGVSLSMSISPEDKIEEDTVVARIRLVGNDFGGVRHDALMPFGLTAVQLSGIMSVLCGIKDAETVYDTSIPGVVRNLRVEHGSTGNYVVNVVVRGDWPYFEGITANLDCDRAILLSKTIDGLLTFMMLGQ